ncbi:hypothetical protein PHYPSEUDO_015618 [Phytophthora pseudosyringae]|uniref:Uncharacterized protein n=1 Tax=Phytophthora pseudosyringae TaxID=221518 RepID=A0A8T1V5P4_9STRA|nr:hypothetical protein PHYPSEUDO_015618 [Phytophthora pseudosyringae]
MTEISTRMAETQRELLELGTPLESLGAQRQQFGKWVDPSTKSTFVTTAIVRVPFGSASCAACRISVLCMSTLAGTTAMINVRSCTICTKHTLSHHRHGILPVNPEAVIFLKENRRFWSARDGSEGG